MSAGLPPPAPEGSGSSGDAQPRRGVGRPRRKGYGLLATVAALFLLAAAIRFLFAGAMELPSGDPWRHMALVRNIREGRGFTLFAGQPYIWYSPLWYYLAAAVSGAGGIKWLSAALSALSVPLYSLYLYRSAGEDRRAALGGGLLFASFGPMVLFTCQLGAEALAIFLLGAALLLGSYSRRPLPCLAAGALFGLALVARLQFVFNVFLFLPLFGRIRRSLFFAGGALLPLALQWWRNRGVIESYPFVFTWDGMATRSSDYTLLSTLVVQLHPAVAKATDLLYDTVLKWPEWLMIGDRIRWEILLFMGLALACVAATKKPSLFLTVVVTISYFFFLDTTLSSRFFRIWLGLFPALLIAVAEVSSRLWGKGGSRRRKAAAAALLLATVLSGALDLRVRKMIPLEYATPPPGALGARHYMVNSGYYHPESLVYRYPDRNFIGMPLYPDQFTEFRRHFPEYRSIIWHGFNIQTELEEYIRNSGEYHLTGRSATPLGYPYAVFTLDGRKVPAPGDPGSGTTRGR